MNKPIVRFSPESLEAAEKALVAHLEKRRLKLLEGATEVAAARIKTLSNDQFPIESVVDKEKLKATVAAYGPKAIRVEEQTHAFEYTANSMPDLIRNVKW